MKRIFFLFLLISMFTHDLPAQKCDTVLIATLPENTISQTDTQKNALFDMPYTGFAIPTVLISYGILAQHLDCLQRFDHKVRRQVSDQVAKKYRVDDYIQYTPALAVFGLDWMGVKSKNNLRDRSFLVISSYLLSTASVQTLKRTTKVKRPDESNLHSFPSGHTATAFVGAHLLFKEYRDTSPWIGITGYVVAGGTGALRILNKKHWMSDVIAGAGFGILSVELSYLLLPVFHHTFGIKDSQKSLSITPIIGFNHVNIGLAYSF